MGSEQINPGDVRRVLGLYIFTSLRHPLPPFSVIRSDRHKCTWHDPASGKCHWRACYRGICLTWFMTHLEPRHARPEPLCCDLGGFGFGLDRSKLHPASSSSMIHDGDAYALLRTPSRGERTTTGQSLGFKSRRESSRTSLAAARGPTTRIAAWGMRDAQGCTPRNPTHFVAAETASFLDRAMGKARVGKLRG